MKRKRHTAEQIIRKLREAEGLEGHAPKHRWSSGTEPLLGNHER